MHVNIILNLLFTRGFHFLTFLTNLTSPNLRCNINLLKINFEISNNLGGENTNLESKLVN